MIEYLKGKITEITPANAVIECYGVGYDVNISLTSYSLLKEGEECKLYIYEAIREDAHLLYGFVKKQERELFILLISVSGVGPNTARIILSSFTPSELENVIASGNVGLLKNVKGIGTKTAERIIVDLKDKIKVGDSTFIIGTREEQEVQEETIAALVMLGYPQPAAKKVVQKISKENPTYKVEELIKAALKAL
ncbi:MAG: Holliday junction branch migration protein RuvA [Bacteroidales bacterium]|nr:Holliday junction branch migration protein RuvA [Bacteroidales bacterium]MBR3608992.1 Holliday junction branch migration protein RuvA [Bacteroidales bacterium]